MDAPSQDHAAPPPATGRHWGRARDAAQRGNWWALGLCVGILLAYLPCFGAGFLNYDDPWLIVENPLFEPHAEHTLRAAFFDFSFETRHALGAEYLPLRDALVWVETRLFGKDPAAMHAVSVGLYALACLFFRSYLLRTLGVGLFAEAAALVFALHPIHVESVAWLAGQKDVLALLFVALALYFHTGATARARVLVPLWVGCACFSKSMSVAVIVLLSATDLVLKRRPDWTRYATTALVIALALAVHLAVGRTVHMLAAPLGGSRLNAFFSMGPVILRYLALLGFPWQLSIEHVVHPRSGADVWVILGYGVLLLWFAHALWSLRRGKPLSSFVFAWFFAPLLPVSQVLAPLQNRMADRYMWLSVMAGALLVGAVCSHLEARGPGVARAAKGSLFALCLALTGSTLDRALTFSDSFLLFSDGTQKTTDGTRSPYQLGLALEELGRPDQAILAYEEVLRRSPRGHVEDARRATNNLAKLLVRKGELTRAERVLQKGLSRFPEDGKMRGNMGKVLAKMGRYEEARVYLGYQH